MDFLNIKIWVICLYYSYNKFRSSSMACFKFRLNILIWKNSPPLLSGASARIQYFLFYIPICFRSPQARQFSKDAGLPSPTRERCANLKKSTRGLGITPLTPFNPRNKKPNRSMQKVWQTPLECKTTQHYKKVKVYGIAEKYARRTFYGYWTLANFILWPFYHQDILYIFGEVVTKDAV